MAETERVVKLDKEETRQFPAVVVSRDAVMALWLKTVTERVEVAITQANDLQVDSDDNMQRATDYVRDYSAERKEIIEKIKPFKERANEIHKQITSLEKELAGDDKSPNPIGGYQEAIVTLKKKINKRLDLLEQMKREEEALLREAAEKDRQRRLDKINGNLDKLMTKSSNLAEQKREYETRLEEGDVTEEEAAIIRQRIAKLDAQISTVQEKVETRQQEAEEASYPMSVAVQTEEKPDGMRSSIIWEPELVNIRQALQAILDGKLPLAAVTFNMAKIKQAGMDQIKGVRGATPKIPGFEWTPRRDTRIR